MNRMSAEMWTLKLILVRSEMGTRSILLEIEGIILKCQRAWLNCFSSVVWNIKLLNNKM